MAGEDLWKKLYGILQGEPQFRSLRQIVAYVLRLIDKPMTSGKELARVIAADPALALNVLTYVNSPSYALPNRVSDLAHATSLLGRDQIRDLVLSVSVVEKMTRGQETKIMQLWKHSYYCGKFAEIIAQTVGGMSGEAFTLGLLHDIGKILVCYSNPAAFSRAIRVYEQHGRKYAHWQCEKQALGLSHAEIGGLSALYWRLPELFYKVIWYHHVPPINFHPSASEEAYLSQVVHAADSLCWAFGIPSVGEMNTRPLKKPEDCVNEAVLAALKLNKDRFRQIVLRTNDALKKGETIFEWIGSVRG